MFDFNFSNPSFIKTYLLEVAWEYSTLLTQLGAKEHTTTVNLTDESKQPQKLSDLPKVPVQLVPGLSSATAPSP